MPISQFYSIHLGPTVLIIAITPMAIGCHDGQKNINRMYTQKNLRKKHSKTEKRTWCSNLRESTYGVWAYCLLCSTEQNDETVKFVLEEKFWLSIFLFIGIYPKKISSCNLRKISMKITWSTKYFPFPIDGWRRRRQSDEGKLSHWKYRAEIQTNWFRSRN